MRVVSKQDVYTTHHKFPNFAARVYSRAFGNEFECRCWE